MAAPFEVRGIDHIVLRAVDPKRLEAFYTDVLGCPLELRQEHINLTQLRAGQALIDIVPAAPGGKPIRDAANLEHFCLRIEPFDAEALRRHFDQHGVECSDVQTRYGAEGRGPSLHIVDPEGNEIEIKGPSV